MLEAFSEDRELLEEVIISVLDSLPAQLNAIETAIIKDNNEALEQAAHTLKGMLSKLQIKSVSQTAFLLEKMGKEGNLTQAEPTFDILKEQIISIKADLEKVIKRRAA